MMDKIGNEFYYNGVDRIDNNSGYDIDNCAPCCHQCNWAKKNLTKADFLNWIERVYKTVINK